MFFAMGITWLFEALSHLLDLVYGPNKVKWVVLVFKILNSLQVSEGIEGKNVET